MHRPAASNAEITTPKLDGTPTSLEDDVLTEPPEDPSPWDDTSFDNDVASLLDTAGTEIVSG